jgi:hypothetical protein
LILSLCSLCQQAGFDVQVYALDGKALIGVFIKRFADPTDRPLISVSSPESGLARKYGQDTGPFGDKRGPVI